MTDRPQFTLFSRLLHWTMAAMILAMLFIGVGMVSTVSGRYDALVAIHKPLGIAVLVLVAIRLINRLLNPAPPLPASMPRWQRRVASASHIALYGLMLALPLVGWAMLSAAPYPIVLYGQLHLPPILPQDAMVYAVLRRTHTGLAYLLFTVFLAHLSGALMHALVHRDGVFASMAPWKTGANRAPRPVRQVAP